MAILKITLTPITKLIKNLTDPSLKMELYRIANEKSIAAEIGQGIAENFAKEGPGWKPLKAQTIRRSVNKKTGKTLSGMTDKEVLAHEQKARKKPLIVWKNDKNISPFRRILQRTGLLKKSATVVGDSNNIYQPRLGKIVWGTKLIYARVHNQGYAKKNIPKREFLVLRGVHLRNIYNIVGRKVKEVIWKSINKS
jgi:phage gpG-like protein